MKTDFSLPLRYAGELPACELCGEPWCPECGCHFADCAHPGPHSDPNDDDEREEDPCPGSPLG